VDCLNRDKTPRFRVKSAEKLHVVERYGAENARRRSKTPNPDSSWAECDLTDTRAENVRRKSETPGSSWIGGNLSFITE